MSVVTRTNRATNPQVAVNATGYAAIAGTGGTASGARATGAGYPNNAPGYFRTSWTVATTAVSGGVQYTQTGLAASTQYSHTVWVRSSKAQTVRLTAQYQTSAAANVGSAAVGSNVVLAANTWTAVSVVGATSGAAVDRVVLQVQATTGGSYWASGDWLDAGAVLVETGNTAGSYFDGSYTNAAGVMYAWTGTAQASTSTATAYTPVITVVAIPTFDPTPRVEVTVADLTPTTNSVTLWRTADGKRQAVRGYRKRDVVSTDFTTDYEVPLGRSVSYELEVLSGLNAQAATTAVATQVNAASGAVQDPLVPSSTVPMYGDRGPGDQPYLRDQAVRDLERAAAVSLIPIMGSPDPVAILGQRMSESGVDISMSTRAAQAAANLRNLLRQTPLVLVRPLPTWWGGLPGLCYMAVGNPVEQPIDEAWGGKLIHWQLKGDLVAAPTMNVLVPLWSYGDVKALWATYQQAQTALSGKTYLQVMKRPAGT